MTWVICEVLNFQQEENKFQNVYNTLGVFRAIPETGFPHEWKTTR